MAGFFKSIKGKVIVGLVVVVLVITVAVVALTTGNKGFRTINISEIVGTAMVAQGDKEYNAYVDMKLQDGYSLTTATESYVRMVLDGDKYFRLEQDSKVEFETLGKENSGKTNITLINGAITNEVTNALGESEEYIINTPNTVLAVKGTFFRVEVHSTEDGVVYTDVYTYGGTVETKTVSPNGQSMSNGTLIEAGYKTSIRMDNNGTGYVVEHYEEGKENVEAIQIEDIPDVDLVDMYVAVLNGHKMFLEVEEVWDIIEERKIQVEDYTSNRDGTVVVPMETTSDKTEVEVDEARSWIYYTGVAYYVSEEKYGVGEDWVAISRYTQNEIPDAQLSQSLAQIIQLCKEHGYTYVGDEADILTIDTKKLDKFGKMYFLMRLTDETLRKEVEQSMIQTYREKHGALPEGDKYEEFLAYINKEIDKHMVLGLEIRNSAGGVFSLHVGGEWAYDGKSFLRLSGECGDVMITEFLKYDEVNKFWYQYY